MLHEQIVDIYLACYMKWNTTVNTKTQLPLLETRNHSVNISLYKGRIRIFNVFQIKHSSEETNWAKWFFSSIGNA